MQGPSTNVLDAYKDTGNYSAVADASPHQLIALLLDGAIQRIAHAKGHLQRKEVGRKGELIGKAIGIVDGLRMSLDAEKGGDLADWLENLYEYIGRRLLQANASDDPAILDEASTLLGEIKSAWDAIPSANGQPPA